MKDTYDFNSCFTPITPKRKATMAERKDLAKRLKIVLAQLSSCTWEQLADIYELEEQDLLEATRLIKLLMKLNESGYDRDQVTDMERMEKLEDNYRHFGDC